MEVVPKILNAKVFHKRLFPKVNSFTYGVYYLALPLSSIYRSPKIENLSINKFNILSFYEKDHGDKKSNLKDWIENILKKYDLNKIVENVVLVSMPRILGYVFNPVSFWLCLDDKNNLRAVLCEVNNTFGESHSYLCAHEKGEVIFDNDWLEAKKMFHVSPFLERDGNYKFRFALKENKLAIWIDFYDKKNKKQLITSIIGQFEHLTKISLIKTFLKHPLVTVKTIFLIHWQALKLVSRGIKYIPKPQQIQDKLSSTLNNKKQVK